MEERRRWNLKGMGEWKGSAISGGIDRDLIGGHQSQIFQLMIFIDLERGRGGDDETNT